MYYIKQKYVSEDIINKSKFISLLIPLSDKKNITSCLALLKKEYPKATHYCYAYNINNEQGSSDDGEPHGTAGVPILQTINYNHLNDVLLVIIRYFGGIKFGAGPLTRVYREQAENVIKKTTLFLQKEFYKYQLEYDYKYEKVVLDFLKNQKILNQEFQNNIVTICLIDKKDIINNLPPEVNIFFLNKCLELVSL